MNHSNTRNSHMVAEQEFRTTTPEPVSQTTAQWSHLAQVMVANRYPDSQPHSS